MEHSRVADASTVQNGASMVLEKVFILGTLLQPRARRRCCHGLLAGRFAGGCLETRLLPQSRLAAACVLMLRWWLEAGGCEIRMTRRMRLNLIMRKLSC